MEPSRLNALKKLEFLSNSYRNLIENDVESGKIIGRNINGHWKANQTCRSMYQSMLDSLAYCSECLETDVPRENIKAMKAKLPSLVSYESPDGQDLILAADVSELINEFCG